MKKLTSLILPLSIVLGVVFLTGLGLWQLQRLAWKQGLVARVEANLKNDPLSVEGVAELRNVCKDIEYRPMTATGTFDHSAEQHFFATHKSKPGYFIYTPLKRAEGDVLFVNRGYVPMEKKQQSLREDGLLQGEVTITGLARSAPAAKPNSFVPDNDLDKNVFYWKSLSQMSGRAYDKTKVQTVPFFMDANNAPNVGGLPEGGVTLIQFPNSHLQYALTWFGLAGALFVVGMIFLIGRRKDSNNKVMV